MKNRKFHFKLLLWVCFIWIVTIGYHLMNICLPLWKQMGDIALLLREKGSHFRNFTWHFVWKWRSLLDDIRKICYSTGLVRLQDLSQRNIMRKTLQDKSQIYLFPLVNGRQKLCRWIMPVRGMEVSPGVGTSSCPPLTRTLFEWEILPLILGSQLQCTSACRSPFANRTTESFWCFTSKS